MKVLIGKAVIHRTKASTSFWLGAVFASFGVWGLRAGQLKEGRSMALPPHLGHPQGPRSRNRGTDLASEIIRWLLPMISNSCASIPEKLFDYATNQALKDCKRVYLFTNQKRYSVSGWSCHWLTTSTLTAFAETCNYVESFESSGVKLNNHKFFLA